MEITNTEEKKIYKIFTIGVIIKGIQGFLELGFGLLVYFISTNAMLAFIAKLSTEEIIETPRDFINHHLAQGVEHLSTNGKYFVAFYLIGHGFVKLFLILGLIKEKLWSYLVFIAIMIGFIVYEFYRYSFTHSISLFILTVVDILFVILVYHEYNILRKAKKKRHASHQS